MSVILISLNSLIDIYLHLLQFTDSFRVLHRRNFPYWFRRSPHYVAAVQCFQISDSVSQVKQRRAMSHDTPFSLRTTGASCFDHTMPVTISFYFKTSSAAFLAQTAYDRCKLSAQPILTGEVLTNPMAVNSVTDASIS